MKLSEIFRDIKYTTIGAYRDFDVTNIVSDSRSVKKGDLFIAIRGTKLDGHFFAEDAIRKGAVAVVSERYIGDFPTVVVDDTRIADSYGWYRLSGADKCALKLIGITGTNGKTSCAHYLTSILNTNGARCAVMGTLGAAFEDESIPFDASEVSDAVANMTTPDPSFLYKTLKRLSDMGAEYAVMEISSHALAQRKIAPLYFELGMFTNLSPEHLDFHRSMEDYFNCKASMFEKCRKAVVSIDDGYGVRLYNQLKMNRQDKTAVSNVDICCEVYGRDGVSYFGVVADKKVNFNSSNLGTFTVLNSYLAAKAAEALGVKSETIALGIARAKPITGRMERAMRSEKKDFEVYIDYAHTPEAVKRAILSLRSFTVKRRLTVVFGCGGDRDKSKRSVMGAIAERYADRVIVTSDNPRSERRESIIEDILSGMRCPDNAVVMVNRREATEYAIKTAERGEVIIFLGKGHETYESIGGKRVPYDEREIIKSITERFDQLTE